MFKNLFNVTILKDDPKDLYALLFKLGLVIYLFVFVTNFYHIWQTYSMYGGPYVAFFVSMGLELAAIFFSFSAIFLKTFLAKFLAVASVALVWFTNYFAMYAEKNIETIGKLNVAMQDKFQVDWVALVSSSYIPIVILGMGYLLGYYYTQYLALSKVKPQEPEEDDSKKSQQELLTQLLDQMKKDQK